MDDTPRSVLHVAHNHPAFHAGGTEIFAKRLSDALTRHTPVRSSFLGAALPGRLTPHPGTNLAGGEMTGDDFVLAGGRFDPVHLSQIDTFGVLKAFRDLLDQIKPDIIHLHHLLLVGVEALHIARATRPDARIVMTLHDFYPLCHHEGLMLTPTGTLCTRSSVPACARCFPDLGMVTLRLRALAVQAAFECVDCFVAPSRVVRDRYVEWGLPADRIHLIPNGSADSGPHPPHLNPDSTARPLNRFGFFGHINRAKGVLVVLAAARRLLARGIEDFSLDIHGAADFAPNDIRATVEAETTALAPHVRWHGGYQTDQVFDRMAAVDWVLVPSVWWENDPLVIQEAFLAKRPVLCSDIGGMAEAVPHGAAGFHVPVGDADAWADAMARCLRLRPGDDGVPRTFPPPRRMEDCARAYLAVYTRPDGADRTAAWP